MKNKILWIIIYIILGILLIGCSSNRYIQKDIKAPIYISEIKDTIKLIDTIYQTEILWIGDIKDSSNSNIGKLTVNPKNKTANINIDKRIDTVKVSIIDTVYQEKTNIIQVVSGLLPFWAEMILIFIAVVLLAISNKSTLKGIFKNVKSI